MLRFYVKQLLNHPVMIQYHSAFLEDKTTRISISEISQENKNVHKYYCIGCGNELVPCMGKVRAKYFRHKVEAEGANCSKETYLHKLGKLMLLEKFHDRTKPFSIRLYDNQTCCRKRDCKFYDAERCVTKEKVLQDEIDIRPHYDSVAVETPLYVKTEGKDIKASFENFEGATKLIPDLLLYNSKRNNLNSAILLEVCYSHKCELAKIESGMRIIEVYVRNEDSIANLMNETFVQEDEEIYIWDKRKKPNVLCYNFKTQSESSEPLNVRTIDRFIYFRKGTCYVPQLHEVITCDKRKVKYNPYSQVELNMSSSDYLGTPSTFHIGLAYLKVKGFDIKNCLLCKYYIGYDNLSMMQDTPFCSLSKKYGTDLYPSQEKAKECSFYREDSVLLDKALKEIGTITIEEV